LHKKLPLAKFLFELVWFSW